MGGQRIALALACAALAACAPVRTTAPGTVGVERQSLLLVSSSQMMQGAKNSYDQVIGQARSQGRLNTDPVMAQRVRQIGQRLVPPTTVFRPDALSWDWEFNVIHEKTINAWCMPGGKIAFYSEIIERLQLDDEEIAAIMGHEIARKVGITMLGRASGRHYLAFTGKERLLRTLAQPTALA